MSINNPMQQPTAGLGRGSAAKSIPSRADAQASQAEPDIMRNPFMVPAVPETVVPVAAPPAVPIQVIEDDDAEEYDTTTIVSSKRRPSTWIYFGGRSIELVQNSVIVGRNPRGLSAPGLQVVRIPDPENTISKVHARLEWIGYGWFITDLNSSNGTFVMHDGVEISIYPNTPTFVERDFRLGLYQLYIEPED